MRSLLRFVSRLLPQHRPAKSGRRFSQADRDAVRFDHKQLQAHRAVMTASQKHRLDNAGGIFPDPSSLDGDIADAIYDMRYASMGQTIDLLITRRPLSPRWEAAGPATLDPTWRTADVLAVANAIYGDQSFEDLPILADALEDAGCDDPAVLGPMRRRPRPHLHGVRMLYRLLDVA